MGVGLRRGRVAVAHGGVRRDRSCLHGVRGLGNHGEGGQPGWDEDDGRADTSERGHVTILR
ncbi:hypothetical protein HMPREF1162_1176 [ [[Propionibacterium] namnetense SK182B-JCVI]|uniref:Uncharacterized protein n=1 Tax=[Propionibacterium] namnetense SK182B-JCVI TaxID=1051006 RepID=F9NUF7_9ACTN|nr:hypothetical protein HMPREF1162_1176 [ [[Propionibacterium] namnetense SK182B-JCVI]